MSAREDTPRANALCMRFMSRTKSSDTDARGILDALRHVLRVLRESSARAEQHVGLSGAQLFALQLIARHGPLSVNDLAAHTLTHQSSVSVVVKKLVERGLCEKASSEEDARRAVIAATPAGRARLERAPDVVQGRLVRAIEQMPASERKELARLLRGLIENVDASAGAPPMFFESAPRPRKTGGSERR